MRGVVAVLLLAATASAARAGELAVEGQVGYFNLNAQNSAKAVFGSADGLTFGGAVRYTAWKGVFVSAGVRTFSKDGGERVFLASPGAAVQKLGFPVSVKLTPVLLSAGYRYVHWKWFVPYASIGAAITSYSEKSEVAGESFDQDVSKTGLVVAAGAETGHGLLRGGVEVGYSTVSSAIGTAGVSKVYGEDDIGGFHAVAKLIVAFDLGGKPKSTPKSTPKPKPVKTAPKP